ncbi:hypothetical protein L2E82_17339 [Cichorium intybus]|uniref:Uncharacterized protein n=2 Tax=Cichorium intybus TaxID=13427 RepID=A0ACB9F8N8_CICIN|nr:hypothetical protein L2E82_17337 [Cichorium intybus]KAI3767250.1 hypothetical protein L2E82_17339 [Cichorium intybus]
MLQLIHFQSVFASTRSASEQPPPDYTSGYHLHRSHILSSDQLSDQLLPLSNTYRRTTHPSNHHKLQVATGNPRWTNVSDSVRPSHSSDPLYHVSGTSSEHFSDKASPRTPSRIQERIVVIMFRSNFRFMGFGST